MAQVNKDMLIADVLKTDRREHGRDPDARGYALRRMSGTPDGVSGRGCYGSRH